MSLTNLINNWFHVALRIGLSIILSGIILSCGDKNKTEAAEFFERGNYHFKKNETERALELFSEAIDKVPDFADAFNNRGLCHEKLGNTEKARNDYRQAVEIDDTFDQAKLNLAAASLDLGELKDCEKYLNQLVKSYSDSAQYYDLRGKLYISKFQTDAAIKDFEKSIDLKPDQPETLTNLGYALYQKKNFRSAESAFQKALLIDGKFGFSLNNLSATYAQLSNWSKALKYSTKAIQTNSSEVSFINTHALNLLENMLLNEASAFIEQSLKLEPENPYSLRNLGVLQLKKERFYESLETLQEIESTHPDVEFIYFYLGQAYLSVDNQLLACKNFERGSILGDTRCQNYFKKCQLS